MRSIWLNTKRLTIGFIQTYDDAILKEIIGWLNNPTTMRYSEQRHQCHTVTSQEEYIQTLNLEDMYLAIYQEGIMIGTMTVTVDRRNMIADVGILLGDTSKWGNGYGYEAWEAVCNRLLEVYRKIEAGCMACNLAMMGICSHYGMMEEGRLEDHFLCH